jgi:hypothetical protein
VTSSGECQRMRNAKTYTGKSWTFQALRFKELSVKIFLK